MTLEEVWKTDPDVALAIEKEAHRQMETLELIASENFVSPAVLEAAGTVLTNKYAEGYPGHRYYGGCIHVDVVEELARERARRLFGAPYANVQPHSGAQANMAVYVAALAPGDTVLGMKLSEGGHLTHGSSVNTSGKLYRFVGYGLDPVSERIDYDALRDLALTERPKMIVAGASAYPRIIDFSRLRSIADEVGSLLMVDMAHIAGLVATGMHPSPVGIADFVTTTTHKTLRGPRGGMILAKEEWGKAIDKAVFPGVQGGPLMHIIAAKAVALQEALSPAFAGYQRQVVKNAQVLAERLLHHSYRLVSGGTDNHLMLLSFVDREDLTGKLAEETLEQVGITVNKNTVPGERRKPTVTSGIRIGTPAVTTRGMKEDAMTEVADLIHAALSHANDEVALAGVREQVIGLCRRYPFYHLP